jgi:hypothetical protein
MMSDGSSATGTRLHIPAKYLPKRKRTEIEKEKKITEWVCTCDGVCEERKRRRICDLDYQTDISAYRLPDGYFCDIFVSLKGLSMLRAVM